MREFPYAIIHCCQIQETLQILLPYICPTVVRLDSGKGINMVPNFYDVLL